MPEQMTQTGAQDPSFGMTTQQGQEELTDDDMGTEDSESEEGGRTQVGSGEKATPEQQDLYERIITNAGKIIHDKQHSENFIRLMQKNGLPDAIHSVMSTIVQGLESKQVEVPTEVLVGVLPEVTALLLELGESEGINFEKEEIKQGMMGAVDKLVGDSANSDGADLTFSCGISRIRNRRYGARTKRLEY